MPKDGTSASCEFVALGVVVVACDMDFDPVVVMFM